MPGKHHVIDHCLLIIASRHSSGTFYQLLAMCRPPYIRGNDQVANFGAYY